jgi:hypothetical protein
MRESPKGNMQITRIAEIQKRDSWKRESRDRLCSNVDARISCNESTVTLHDIVSVNEGGGGFVDLNKFAKKEDFTA